MNKTELLNKLARDNGERLLLARALDKLELARQRNIPACTGFLSPQERASVENLLNTCGHPRHLFFGGYEGAERTVCAFLPDWQEAEDWQGDGESCPVRALRCTWSGGQKLTHRDFLGSILGLGLDREKSIISNKIHTTFTANAANGGTIFARRGPAISIPKIPAMESSPCVVLIPKSACRSTSTASRTVTPTTLLLLPVSLLYMLTTATQKAITRYTLKL